MGAMGGFDATTGGGAFGGGGGYGAGGFNADAAGGSQAAGKAGGGQGGKKEQSLMPVTLRMILDAKQNQNGEDMWIINGREISQVTFVAMIASVDEKSTNVTYKMDDGTAFLDVKVWTDNDDSDQAHEKRSHMRYAAWRTRYAAGHRAPRAHAPGRRPPRRPPPRARARAPASRRAARARTCECSASRARCRAT